MSGPEEFLNQSVQGREVEPPILSAPSLSFHDGAARESAAGGRGLPPAAPSLEWTLPVQHLSASSLSMLAVCPRQFQQRYLLGRKEPPSQAQIVGSSFHKTIEFNFRQKIETGTDLDITTVQDYLLDQAFPTLVEQEQESTGHDVVWDDQDDAKLSVTKMVNSYHKYTAPGIQPKEVELEFSHSIEGVPVPLVGRIDVVDDAQVIDLKTSKRKISSIKPQWRMQARIYQTSRPLAASFHVVTTRGDIMPHLMLPYNLHQFFATEQWVKNLAWTANYYYSTFGTDDWPTTGVLHDWRCGWCGYKSDCPAWAGKGA